MSNYQYDPSRAWQPDKTVEQLAKERGKENSRINREAMWLLKQQPCADCKLRWHPQVMTFDHIDRRTVTKNRNAKNINSVTYYRPEIFARLLKNMSVVCLNCHRLRELRRDVNDPKINLAHREEPLQLLEQCTKGALL